MHNVIASEGVKMNVLYFLKLICRKGIIYSHCTPPAVYTVVHVNAQLFCIKQIVNFLIIPYIFMHKLILYCKLYGLHRF